jgi:hypothetical protein
MTTSRTAGYISLFFLTIALVLFGFMIYKFYFEGKVKSRIVLEEVLKMKITKVDIDTLSGGDIFSTYIVGNKYEITFIRKNPKPFSTMGEDEVYITNIYGEIVFSYDTRYHSMRSAYYSDYERLMNYLKLTTLMDY